MYPYPRAIARFFLARRKGKLDFYDAFVTHHRAWPWDTDIFGELNHGRILTLFELARWEMTTRMGMDRLVLKEGFGFAIAGTSVRYRRRIPTWSRYQVKTRFLGFDGRFFYINQSMWMGDEPCHDALLRAAFMHGGKSVPAAEMAAKMGMTESPPLPEWVTKWIEADAARPWPPDVKILP
jgi:acyl-CoA thioesterase FadM